jgi:hypothetical protein
MYHQHQASIKTIPWRGWLNADESFLLSRLSLGGRVLCYRDYPLAWTISFSLCYGIKYKEYTYSSLASVSQNTAATFHGWIRSILIIDGRWYWRNQWPAATRESVRGQVGSQKNYIFWTLNMMPSNVLVGKTTIKNHDLLGHEHRSTSPQSRDDLLKCRVTDGRIKIMRRSPLPLPS